MPITAPKPHVLLVEDDASIAQVVCAFLQFEGFDCSHATTGDMALEMAFERQPDAVLLDWMVPSPDGLALLKRWRAESETRNLPIIMLTALDDENDIVRALEAGADDYVCKPFSTRELLARLRSLLRRQGRWTTLIKNTQRSRLTPFASQKSEDELPAFSPSAQSVLVSWLGCVAIDAARHRVKVLSTDGASHALKLDPTAYRLMLTLYERPEHILDRNTLHAAVWGRYAQTDLRSVDVYIKRLRECLGEINPAASAQIETIRGVGYRFAIAV